MEQSFSPRNIGIDLLRGICILYIVGFWHMLNYTKAIAHYDNFITYRLTYIVLATFVFISGYFVGSSDVHVSTASIMQFYKKRLLRIYPLYLLAIGLFTIYRISEPLTSLKAIFLISAILEPAIPTLWFATMLMLFYLVAPLAIIACRSMPNNWFLICCTILAMVLVFVVIVIEPIDIRTAIYFPSFLLGVFYANTKKPNALTNTQRAFGVLIIAVCIPICGIETTQGRFKLLVQMPLVTICAPLLFDAFQRMRISSIKSIHIISLLSYASYGMYLFHRPVYTVLRKIYFPKTHLLQLAYLLLLGLPCIVLLSFQVQSHYNRLIDRLTQRIRIGSSPVNGSSM